MADTSKPTTVAGTNARIDHMERNLRAERRAWRFIGVGALLAMIVFVIVTDRAIDQIVAQRTESRAALCAKDQRFATAHNRLVLGIATSAGTREIPPSLKDAVNEQLVDVPTCTPESIREFYEGNKP